MRSQSSFLVRAAVLAALSATVSGCYSKATGYDGKFTFAYAAGLDFENFVKPVAPGAKLDVEVFANGTDDNLVITSAKSSRPGILAVHSIDKRRVVLLGVAPGTADIEITATGSKGDTLTDKMYLHVAKPVVHRLQHACTDEADAAYVLGDDVNVFHSLATADGRPVVGYDYVPLRITPEKALTLVAQPQGANVYMYRARAAGESISIRSTVDDTALTARVVKRGDLKEATLQCSSDCKTVEGGSRYIVARVSLGTTPLCSQTALTKARSLTPEICSVTAKLEDDDGTESNHEQLAVLKGLKFGVCKYEVTLPELDGGKGVRLTGESKVGRLEFPGDGGAESLGVVRTGMAVRLFVAFGWLAPKLGALAFVAWRRRRRCPEATSRDA